MPSSWPRACCSRILDSNVRGEEDTETEGGKEGEEDEVDADAEPSTVVTSEMRDTGRNDEATTMPSDNGITLEKVEGDLSLSTDRTLVALAATKDCGTARPDTGVAIIDDAAEFALSNRSSTTLFREDSIVSANRARV